MKSLFLLLLLCHVSSPVKHSIKIVATTSSGIQNLPEFVMSVLVDDIQACYCDSNKTLEVNHDVWKKLFKENPGLMDLFSERCFRTLPRYYKSKLYKNMQHFSQSGGVHILQATEGCELDEQTGETVFLRFGYDGEDFMSFDLKKRTWILLKPEADIIKQEWDADKATIQTYVDLMSQMYCKWLSLAVNYGKSVLLRTDLPSVSLLQKSPSSPVSCQATGFYPDRATMFWRKDGQELHENVDHGEILPNHDGTFQMRVDLDISSLKPEDWRRYDCVFQFSGVEKNITTKLDKAVIRTNWVPGPPVGAIVGVVVGLMLLLVCITALVIWRKKKNIGSQ